MQTRRSAGLAGSVPPAVPAPLVPRRGSPARGRPPLGALRQRGRPPAHCPPRQRPLAPTPCPPRQWAASTERQQDPPGFASPRGQPALGTPARGSAGRGLHRSVPLSARQQLRRGAARDGGSQRRAGRGRRRASGAEPLPGARHNPQKVAARRKSRILPEPRPPGWRAVAKGHQKQRCSGGTAHLCRFPAASAAERRPGRRRRSPPCPAPRRAPASPELSAETGRNCRRSESWGAAPPSLPQHHVMPAERGGDPRQPPRTSPGAPRGRAKFSEGGRGAPASPAPSPSRRRCRGAPRPLCPPGLLITSRPPPRLGRGARGTGDSPRSLRVPPARAHRWQPERAVGTAGPSPAARRRSPPTGAPQHPRPREGLRGGAAPPFPPPSP